MTTNTFRQYLGSQDGSSYVIRLRTRKGQAYRTAPVIARFDTYDAMLAAWDMATSAEGMVDAFPNN